MEKDDDDLQVAYDSVMKCVLQFRSNGESRQLV